MRSHEQPCVTAGATEGEFKGKRPSNLGLWFQRAQSEPEPKQLLKLRQTEISSPAFRKRRPWWCCSSAPSRLPRRLGSVQLHLPAAPSDGRELCFQLMTDVSPSSSLSPSRHVAAMRSTPGEWRRRSSGSKRFLIWCLREEPATPPSFTLPVGSTWNWLCCGAFWEG